ncbi:Cullin family profile domain-containing protein [Entamoeba marina]
MDFNITEKHHIDKLFDNLSSFFDSIFNEEKLRLSEINGYYCLVYSCFDDVSYAADYGLDKLEEVLVEYLKKNTVNATVKSVLKHTFKDTFFLYLVDTINIFDVLIDLLSANRAEHFLSTERSFNDYLTFQQSLLPKSVGDALQCLDNFITNEQEMINTAFLPNMVQTVSDMLRDNVLLKMSPIIVDQFTNLLESKSKTEIQTISRLWSSSNDLNLFLKPLNDYFTKCFTTTLDNYFNNIRSFENNTSEIVKFFFQMKDITQELRMEYFKGDTVLCECISNAFKSCLGKNRLSVLGSSKETDVILANYSHNLLISFTNEDDVLKTLFSILDVVYYLPIKDTFISIYQQLLVKRIIQMKLRSTSIEEIIVTEINKQISCPTASKLKKALNDYLISQEITNSFNSTHSTPFKFNIIVFSKFLVTPNDMYCDMPICPTLQTIWDSFVILYKNKHSERKLQLNGLSTSVTLLYDNGIKKSTLVVTYIQYLILKQLEISNDQTIKTLQETIAPKLTTFKNHLQSLINIGLLDINDETSINSNISLSRNIVEDKQLLEDVNELINTNNIRKKQKDTSNDERQFTAVIGFQVRLMKQKQQLDYKTLISETTSNVSKGFEADVRLAKKGIEYLIEKEYIKRDEEDNNIFQYIN